MQQIFFIFILIFSLSACHSAEKDAKKIESILIQQNNSDINVEETNQCIALIDDFVSKYGNHEKTPSFLAIKAKMMMGLQRNKDAYDTYVQIVTAYPKAKECEIALFMQAFLLENQLNDKEKSITAYQEFIQKYPTSEWKDDATFALENMHKTDEELIEMFRKMNPEDTIGY